MRILVTGMTPQHINSQGRDGQYDNNWDILAAKGLPELGHQIDWRETTPGEDLSSYDMAVVGVHALNGLQTLRYKHGACWALSQLPSLVVTNDARYSDVWRSMEHTAAFWKCEHMTASHQKRFNAALKHSKVIDKARYRLMVGNYTGLIPRWKRIGSLEPYLKVNKTKELLSWDPSCYVDCSPRYNGEKIRQWCVAALQNLGWFLDYEKPTWPVVGPYKPWVKKTVPKGVESNAWRLTQQEVLDLMLISAGTLVFPYDESAYNGGWWRIRHLHALANRCAIYIGGNEYSQLGPEWRLTLSDLEKLSTSEMEYVADCQAKSLFGVVDCKSEALSDLQIALNKAKERGPLV